MATESKEQKKTLGRVMHEFKHGELETAAGTRVKSRKQAIAIALSESGSSNQNSPSQNKSNLRKTKAKEHKGETGQQAREGKAHVGAGHEGHTKTELLKEARRRDIAGRSKMSKDDLVKALDRKSD